VGGGYTVVGDNKMKKTISILLLFFAIGLISGQTIQIKDFNQDGLNDTLTYESYGNSVNEIQYVDGSTGKQYSFYNYPSYNDFLYFIPISKDIINVLELLNSIQELFFSNLKRSKITPELKWLISAYEFSNDENSNPHYSRIYKVPKDWYNWPPIFPEAIYMIVDTDTLKIPDYYRREGENSQFGWLLYYGHNHRQFINNQIKSDFTKTKSTNTFDLYKSSHGLLMRNEEQFSWLFHSNSNLTGGPEKLRWTSIEKVLIYEKFVFVHHKSPIRGENKVFVINTENGTVGDLKFENAFLNNKIKCFSINILDNVLIVKSTISNDCMRSEGEIEEVKFEIESLTKELTISNTK